MIVDDSLTVRTIFKRMVETDPALSVVATASSAERAIASLKDTPADVILLDLEMPGMGGLKALPAILETGRTARVLVVSSLTQDGAEHTVSALSMGAADTMLKPRPGGFDEGYRAQLLGKIRALGDSANDAKADVGDPSTHVLSASAPASASASVSTSTSTSTSGASSRASTALPSRRPEILAIGASTGGIHAINVMLRGLTPAFDIPILITQHLPASFISVFARQMEMACARPAVIAEEGTEIRRGEVVIASGHGHMVVKRTEDRLFAHTSTEPAKSGCLPSVDPMFASLAEVCGSGVLAIVLSGMGRDGLEGAKAVAEAGGTIYAQNPETSAVWGMPGAVAKAGLTTLVAEPSELGRALMVAARCQPARENS